MAYPTHWLLQFGGSLFQEEEWTCGLRMQYPTQFVQDVVEEDVIEELQEDLEAWVGRGNSFLSNAVKLNFVKFNQIDAEGHYAEETATHARFFADVPGGPGSASMPPQVAVCLTLRTAVQRGMAATGRIYAPAMAISPEQVSGLMDASQVALMAESFKTLIGDLNNAPGIGILEGKVVVASQGGQGGPGILRPVTAVSVGRVFDTHRSRRSSLPETPTTVQL